jgi:hypothetical protein
MRKGRIISIAVLCIVAVAVIPFTVYGADKLIVKDSGGTNTLFAVEDGTSVPNRVLRVLSGVPIMQNAGTAGFDFRNTGATFGGSISVGVAGNPNLYANWLASTNARDDATKVAWAVRLDIGNDEVRLVRVPVGGSPTDVFDVHGNGAITSITGATLTAGGVWSNFSSRAAKENIAELSSAAANETLKGLNPVTYNYKVDKEQHYVGFIAEDVPEMVAMKDRKSLSPMDIVAVLTKVVQDKSQVIDEQKKTLDALAAKLEKIEAQLNKLQSKDYTAQK